MNSKIKIYFRNKWNRDPILVYYGYIVSIDPFIQRGNEKTAITCLGAASKLKNDFLAEAGEYLAYQVENQKIDQHINEILVNYRNSINDTYGDFDPCMIDNPATYWADTNYIEDTSVMGTIPYRYFIMKHLDAVHEIGKFLSKNQGGGAYWYYYLAEDDTTGKSRFILKKLSATADYTLQINKHISSLSMRRNIEGVVNTVYFWNEQGTFGDKVLMTAKDSTSQTNYDRIADRITDAKITTYTQADLLAQARLKEAKDVKSEITVTVTDVNFDILALRLGQVINIRDTKKGTDLYPDDVMVIQKMILTPRDVILELAKPRPDLSTQVETDREYIDRQLTWFGKIMTRVDATHLEPGGLHWITDDITFSSDSNTQISWSAGTFKLPNDVYRVITSGDTGNMGTDDTYLYVDEKNVWSTRDTVGSGAAVVSGTGNVKAGENTLVDSGKSWKKDEWKGYVLWINPSGGSEEKHIISQNYSTQLMVEGHDPFDTTDAACPYEIHKLVLRQTTQLSKKGVQADSGSVTTLVDSALTEVADFWNGYELKILSGNNVGLTRVVNDFVATADRLVFDALPYAIAGGEHYELYLNPETQILISTGVPTADGNQEAEIIPKMSAIEDSIYFNAASHIVNKSITANEIMANTITANEILARTITANEIAANTITSNEINTGSINIGDWGGDLDDISDGGTYKKTTTNEKTGAGRGYNGFSASYKITKGFVESDLSAIGLPANGIRIDSNGIYGRKSGSTTFYINSTGDAYFEGTIGASVLTGNSIIGGTIKTAVSGKRIEIFSTGSHANEIAFYDAGNNLGGTILGQSSKIYVSGDGFNVECEMWLEDALHPDVLDTLIPISSNNYDIGSYSYQWRYIYAKYLISGKLYGDTGLGSVFKVADMVANNFSLAVNLDMNNHNISELNTLGFQSKTSSPGSPGQINYYDFSGTQQFRGNVGGWVGSFDMTAA